MAQLEFEIIRRYFKESGLAFAKSGVDLGIGDDCALLSPDPDQQLALSMDLLLEGVHFPSHALPELIAQRALAVNLSDLAAMGAEPLCFTLGLSIPKADSLWLEAFSKGLLACAMHYQCPLVGGDLVRGDLSIAIQVHGQLPRGKAVLRSTAKVGDQVYVTGTLGDAAIALMVFAKLTEKNAHSDAASGLSLAALTPTHRDFFINRFYRPTPRLQAGVLLRDYATAMLDISDGLIGDLGQICTASAVGAVIEVSRLPFSAAMLACVNSDQRQQAALSGGDDYELCFTVAESRCHDMEQVLSDLGLPVTRIGVIIAGDSVQCVDDEGAVLQVNGAGYSHFTGEYQ